MNWLPCILPPETGTVLEVFRKNASFFSEIWLHFFCFCDIRLTLISKTCQVYFSYFLYSRSIGPFFRKRSARPNDSIFEIGWTALHYAVAYGHTECAFALLTTGRARLDIGDFLDNLPIHFAVEFERRQEIKLLLMHNADPHAENRHSHWKNKGCFTLSRRFGDSAYSIAVEEGIEIALIEMRSWLSHSSQMMATRSANLLNIFLTSLWQENGKSSMNAFLLNICSVLWTWLRQCCSNFWQLWFCKFQTWTELNRTSSFLDVVWPSLWIEVCGRSLKIFILFGSSSLTGRMPLTADTHYTIFLHLCTARQKIRVKFK